MDRLNHINLGLLWLALVVAFAIGFGIGTLLHRRRR